MNIQDRPIPRIMHVVLSMEVGGAERLVYDMASSPRFAAARPVICCLDQLGELGVRLQECGFLVYCKGRRSGIDLSVISWLSEIMVRERIEVAHAHQYTPLFYTVPAAKLAGRVQVVYTEHGRFYPDRRSWKRSLFNPLLALGVDHLVSISAFTAQAMAEFDKLPFCRIKVIHNGVNLDRLNPPFDYAAKRSSLGVGPNCKVLGTASRLNEIKNIPMMLRVFKLVLGEFPESCLVIAGDGPEKEALLALAASLGISEQVKFVGLRFDLPEMYQLFDVFLLSSFTEGISVTLLEAMASGVPAVVTDVGGNGEVVVQGETGYLVPLEEDAPMAERVAELLRSPQQARLLGSGGKKRVDAEFQFPKMLESYIKLYRSAR
jgi:L-malate glycosyltransferase